MNPYTARIQVVREDLVHVLDLPWEEVPSIPVVAPIGHSVILDAMAMVEGNGHKVEVIWCHPADAVDFRKWDKLTTGWIPETRLEFLDLGLVGTFWTRALVMSDSDVPRGFVYVMGEKGSGGLLEEFWSPKQFALITVTR